MTHVAPVGARPTNLASLPRLLAYAQGLGLERHLSRAKRGIPTLALALVWLADRLVMREGPRYLGLATNPSERVPRPAERLLALLTPRTVER